MPVAQLCGSPKLSAITAPLLAKKGTRSALTTNCPIYTNAMPLSLLPVVISDVKVHRLPLYLEPRSN